MGTSRYGHIRCAALCRRPLGTTVAFPRSSLPPCWAAPASLARLGGPMTGICAQRVGSAEVQRELCGNPGDDVWLKAPVSRRVPSLGHTTVILFRQPDAIDDHLSEVAREGARRMLAQMLIAEADAFVAQWEDLKLPDGRDRVVRARPWTAAQSRPGLGLSKSRSSKCRLTRPPPGRPCDGSPDRASCPLLCRPRRLERPLKRSASRHSGSIRPP
jgi:hypothetical protein